MIPAPQLYSRISVSTPFPPIILLLLLLLLHHLVISVSTNLSLSPFYFTERVNAYYTYYTSLLHENIIGIPPNACAYTYYDIYVYTLYIRSKRSKADVLEREREWRLSRRWIHRPGSRVNEPRTPPWWVAFAAEKRRERIELSGPRKRRNPKKRKRRFVFTAVFGDNLKYLGF